MATLGKTATPNTGTHGWIASGTEPQDAMNFTTTQGGLYTSVTFWAAGSSALTLHGVIWDNTGTPIAFGPGVSTSGGAASGVGANQWWTDTFATPLFIASGTSIWIGWQRDASSGTIYWAYNGTDHSPDAHWWTNYGSTGQGFSGASAQSPAGAIAAYVTYTPTQAHRWHSGAWTAGPVKRQHSSAWSTAVVNREKSGVWTPSS